MNLPFFGSDVGDEADWGTHVFRTSCFVLDIGPSNSRWTSQTAAALGRNKFRASNTNQVQSEGVSSAAAGHRGGGAALDLASGVLQGAPLTLTSLFSTRLRNVVL